VPLNHVVVTVGDRPGAAGPAENEHRFDAGGAAAPRGSSYIFRSWFRRWPLLSDIMSSRF
jgi:hypothetical protein